MAPSSPPNSDAPPAKQPKNGGHDRLRKHQWKKGQSGNPSGFNSPDKRAFAKAAREYGEEAMRTLVRLMRQKRSADVSLRACVEILNRGFGKPTESIEIDNKQFVAFVPLPLERDEWLAAVQQRKLANGSNGHGVTIEQTTTYETPSAPGSPSPGSKLNS